MSQSVSRPEISILVTDLDNTLWDWLEMWHASFSAMLSELVELSGIPQAQLESEIRTIHQKRGTSEYSHLIQEIPSLVDKHPGGDLAEIYDGAIHAYRRARKKTMRLYPGVLETLTELRANGTRIIAYTESQAYYTSYRLRSLGLDGIIDEVLSPPDHDFPLGIRPKDLRMYPKDAYGLKITRHTSTRLGVLKPDPRVLKSIVGKGKNPRRVAYVGDSMAKDVAMARAVGVVDIHAAYGMVPHDYRYALLQRVSHWTDANLEREQHYQSIEPATSYVLKRAFGELLEIVEFGTEP